MRSSSIPKALFLVVLLFGLSVPAVAQGFTGTVETKVYSLRNDDLLDQTEDDLEAIMTVPIATIAAAPGVEVDEFTMKVRGMVVHTTMEMGEMGVDYGANRFWMYNPRNDTHAAWTGDELQEMMSSMMGGPAGGREGPAGAMASAMAQARQAAGNMPVGTEGPYSLNRSDNCGDWWGGHMGEVSFDADPMQEGWLLHACVTNDYPDAWESMKAMEEAVKQFDMEAEEDAEDVMEAAILEHGFPMVTRRLKQGGGFSVSFDFELTVMSVTPGPISAEEVAPKGRELPLQEFMQQLMGGGPGR